MTDVALDPADADFVDGEIASGRYGDPQSVIRAALASLREAREDAATQARFDALMDERLADLDAGRFVEVATEHLDAWLKDVTVSDAA